MSEAVVLTSRELGITWRNPPRVLAGGLLGRVCPVGPLSIVPRILAGGCLAHPPGDDVTEKRTLHVGPHGKAHSVRWASRKGALCPRHSRRVRLSVRSCRQNALFRRVRLFSPGQTSSRLTQKRILCSLPHAKAHSVLTASRKSAFCTLGLTEKRSLHVGPHGKAQSACWASRKGAFCARAVAQSASFCEVRPQAEVRGPRRNPPRSLAGGCPGAFAQLGHFP